MILSICDSPDVLSVINIVIVIMKIIKIAVPIILIVSIMIGIGKAIINNDNDALSKSLRGSVAKMIAAVLVFLMPTFVNLVTNVAGSPSFKECINFNEKFDIRGLYENQVNYLFPFNLKNFKFFNTKIFFSSI
jgi:hypothetical protein